MRLYGEKAIEWAEAMGRETVHAYADPSGPEDRMVSLDEAREIAAEDPTLIHAKVSLMGWDRLDLLEDGAGGLAWHAVGTGLMVPDIEYQPAGLALDDARLWRDWAPHCLAEEVELATADMLRSYARVATYDAETDQVRVVGEPGTAARAYLGETTEDDQ